jgi:hemerythrin
MGHFRPCLGKTACTEGGDHCHACGRSFEELMERSGFPAIGEHQGEHARVLGEMARLLERVAKGRTQMARVYVVEQVPGWFTLHARTMDSALAGHLRRGSLRNSIDVAQLRRERGLKVE